MRNPLLAILFQPFQTLPLPPPNAYTSKTLLITGSTCGIGYQAALHALRLNAARVILTARNLDKGTTAKSSLLAHPTLSHIPDLAARIEVWELDMADFASIKQFAARAGSELEKLDCVFLNAGAVFREFETTGDGWERTMQINVLGTALLAVLLLPKMVAQQARKGAADSDVYDPPHICITSSGAHAMALFAERNEPHGKILAKMNQEDNYNVRQKAEFGAQYHTTKLLNIYTAQRLARVVPNDSQMRPVVVVSSVCPGFCVSELARGGLPFPMNVFRAVFGRTAEVGSRNLLAAVGMGEESHGRWIMDCTVTEPANLAIGDEGRIVGDKVWAEMIDVLKGVSPEVSGILSGQFGVVA